MFGLGWRDDVLVLAYSSRYPLNASFHWVLGGLGNG